MKTFFWLAHGFCNFNFLLALIFLDSIKQKNWYNYCEQQLSPGSKP